VAEPKHFDPASDDDDVQAVLDGSWRAATAALREGMEHLRGMAPELYHHLPETAREEIDSALSLSERALAAMHRAGPHVLGTEDYRAFLAAQTTRRIGR